ncbi:MAG: NADPH-dependent 7-cyano-7-deazaguanine reductase QueF [Candidatus Latescibacteria bacterium]|nr:NADPH-dependent 7-cyano-7-deazaguanine reductase QueF [Candidatus Latescibacterota bacterium]
MTLEPRTKQFEFLGAEALTPEVLETFPYEFPGQSLDIVIDTDEFTAMCPWTGLPDFATVSISYTPDQKCLELKAYKFYLLSYRSVGMVQEHVTRRILNDLVAYVEPIHMTVKTDYRVRGGIHTTCTAEYADHSQAAR